MPVDQRVGPPAGPVGAPRAAAATAVAAWGLAALSVVLLVAARPALTGDLLFYAVDACDAVVYGLVCAVVLSRRRHPVAVLLAVVAVGHGLAAVGFTYPRVQVAGAPLPGAEAVQLLNGTGWVPGSLALYLVVPWLVRDGGLGRGRWGLAVGAAVTALATGAAVVRALWDAAGAQAVFAGAVALSVPVGAVATAAVVRRWRRGAPAERTGLGWLALGTGALTVSWVPLVVPLGLPVWATPVVQLLAQVVFPASVLVVVLRQQLWGLQLAVSRGVVGGGLVAGLLVLYAAVTALGSLALPGATDPAPAVVHAAGAVAVALAVQPLRSWLAQRAERLVRGEAADPRRAVQRLGSSLGRARTAEELLAGLAESVAGALRLRAVRIVADGAPVAAWGEDDGAGTAPGAVVPLVHRGQAVGELHAVTPPGEVLDARSLRALHELGAVVAAGVALVRISADLEGARDRLTSVRLEERRTVRRELHDGLGPSLAGIRLGLQGARNLVGTDPGAASQLLAALQAELDGRVEAVRALSRALLPPVLDELGLEPALADLAARWRTTGLDVRVSCDLPPVLAPALAAAAYGIAAEAVTNVARHSGATTCTVSVTSTPASGERAGAAGPALRVVVDDDGRGVAADAVVGVGSRSMRERAEERGGSFARVPLQPRGTRIEAVLPLGSL